MPQNNLHQHRFFPRSTARQLFDFGVKAASPEWRTRSAIWDWLERQDIDLETLSWQAFAFGKAAEKMLSGTQIMPCPPKKTVIITNIENLPKKLGLSDDNTILGGHPLPDDDSVMGAKVLLDQAQSAKKGDVCVVLISGGGSAMAALPAEGLTLADKIKTTELLLACGADIHEMNAVRKHLSAFKGGGLAKACYPARSLVLILSDVVGDDPSTIASGPMSPDPTTYQDAWDVLKKYDLIEELPMNVQQHLYCGMKGEIPETPKSDDPIFKNNNVETHIIGSNRHSIRAMLENLSEKTGGIPIIRHPEPIIGEAREAAAMLVKKYGKLKRPVIILGGGETTVTLKGRGKGGRNQEMALAFAITAEKAGLQDFTFLSGGTDGIDGPTNAAGGIVDGQSLQRMRDEEVTPEEELTLNNSYKALKASGDLLVTDDLSLSVDGIFSRGTGTNVADLQILILY